MSGDEQKVATGKKVGKAAPSRGSKPGELRGNAGRGRKKGVPNKQTASVKQAIEDAFHGLGGAPALMKWGRENPGDFYTKIWVKIMPQGVEHSGKVTLESLLEGTTE